MTNFIPRHVHMADPQNRQDERQKFYTHFLKEASKSTFKLTNNQRAYNTGRLVHREKTQKLHEDLVDASPTTLRIRLVVHY
jgi:hypothetical protein